MEMKMRLRVGATLLLGLGWIVGNAPMVFADGGGEGGKLLLTGYALFGGFVIVGYFIMVSGIPQRITHLFFARSAEKKEPSRIADRTRAGMELKGGRK